MEVLTKIQAMNQIWEHDTKSIGCRTVLWGKRLLVMQVYA